MANIQDRSRDAFMLTGPLRKKGYDWWWHSFTGYNEHTGEERSFFLEFFTVNPAHGCAEPIFGQKGEGKNPSYLMVKCGSWGEDGVQLHRFFGWDHVRVRMGNNFGVKAADCYLDEEKTCGQVSIAETDAKIHPEWMCGSGSMRWKLKIRKETAFHVGYGAGWLFRKLNSFEMYWHAQGMKTAYEGWVDFNGERYLVRPEDCFGYADKNWGSDFTSPWVWLSSNDLISTITGERLENSVFDIGGGRPRAFKIPLNRKLLSDFWYEGKSYEFNFSKFWTFCRTRFDCRETETEIIWHVEQKTRRAKMITDIRCLKKDMLLVNYEAPNGKKLHNRLWNGGNGSGTVSLYVKKRGRYRLLDRVSAKHVGCEYGEYSKN